LDPANALAEFNELNNADSVTLGGTDLAVSLVTSTVESNGAVRLLAQVLNLGAPAALASVLTLRRADATNVTTAAVPELGPGRLAQLALELPAGTQPMGQAWYELRADATGVTPDVNTNNNVLQFMANLWLDTDEDGLPDPWEIACGLSPTNAADAQLDFDGDTLSNLAEYRAGTDPTDPQSYLRILQLAVDATSGVRISWGSVSNRLYTLQHSGDLMAGFTNLATHLPATPPENVYWDLPATHRTRGFYRIRIE
jgi:hypothetical protein